MAKNNEIDKTGIKLEERMSFSIGGGSVWRLLKPWKNVHWGMWLKPGILDLKVITLTQPPMRKSL
jgi:hypothetical protein